jgi:hypothetical protein
MTRIEKLQLSNKTISWLSREIAEVQYYINCIKNDKEVNDKKGIINPYDLRDIDYLETRLEELHNRSEFEVRNLKKLKKQR